MLHNSANTASFFSVVMAALLFSLCLVGIAAAQTNTSLGTGALVSNTTGSNNTALGLNALFTNSIGNRVPCIAILIVSTTATFALLQIRQQLPLSGVLFRLASESSHIDSHEPRLIGLFATLACKKSLEYLDIIALRYEPVQRPVSDQEPQGPSVRRLNQR